MQACGEREKALSFVEKAIALDSRCVLAFLLRGELLLAAGKADQAIVAYFQANNYAKCLASFTGLVTAYIAVRKFKEALATAKEAVAQHPTASHLAEVSIEDSARLAFVSVFFSRRDGRTRDPLERVYDGECFSWRAYVDTSTSRVGMIVPKSDGLETFPVVASSETKARIPAR